MRDRRLVAHHEAGHALLAWMHCRPGSVLAVVGDNGRSAGVVLFDASKAPPWAARAIACAGPLAEALALERGEASDAATPAPVEKVDWNDEGIAIMAEPLYTPADLARIEGSARQRTIEAQTLRTLRQHWPAVEALALALEAHRGLRPREIDRIMRQHGVRRALA